MVGRSVGRTVGRAVGSVRSVGSAGRSVGSVGSVGRSVGRSVILAPSWLTFGALLEEPWVNLDALGAN